MVKKASKLRPYESSKGYGWITFGEHMAERMCERKATQEKRALPFLFKEDKYWKVFFAQQVRYANKLRQEFSKEAVFATFKRGDTAWCFSLMSPKIRATVVDEHRKFMRELVEPTSTYEYVEPPAIERAPLAPSNISSRQRSSISRLDD